MKLFAPVDRMIGMGRMPRIHYPGAVYHVMARGVDGRDTFVDDRDRSKFLEVLSRVAVESTADVIAYCLMPNHFHIAIRVGTVALAPIMQRLLTTYSLVFNGRHDRTGHLFQARYKAILCLDDAYLFALVRYIHMNPVRAGIVASPRDWPWSSARDHRIQADQEVDLVAFDPWPKDAVEPLNLMRQGETDGLDIASVGAVIVARTGISVQELRSETRRRPVVAAKRLFAQEAVRRGHSLTSIAIWLHSAPSSVTRYARDNTANTGKPDTPMVSSR